MQLRTFYAQDDEGNALGNADVFVYLPGTTTLATGLKNIAGDNLLNPFKADVDSKIEFAAPSGLYDIRVTSGDRDRTVHKVQFADSTEFAKHVELGSAAYESTASFATSAQGAKADTALQPEDESRFATSAQGAKADTALQPSGSTVTDITLTSYTETVFPHPGPEPDSNLVMVNRSDGGIQTLTLTADSVLTWTLNDGEKIQLYLTPAGFNVTNWGVTHWMTDVPTLATENMVVVEKVGGNIYAWDGGSR